jgi:hypothetical protein
LINAYYFKTFMRFPSLFLLTGLLLANAALAQQVESRKYSNEFLAIGVDARALGMSNSIVAGVNDVTSGYWNPAGLTSMNSEYQVALMHAEYFAGIAKFDYGAFAKKIDERSALGLSIVRFGVDKIPNTIRLIDAEGNINYDNVVDFSAADYAFIISYARRTANSNLSYGVNAKIIYRMVGDFAHAYGFGLDAGAQYRAGDWKFGAMARDVTSTFNAWTFTLDETTKDVFEQTGNEVPKSVVELTLPKLLLATGRYFPIGQKFSIFSELNLDLTFDGQRNTPVSSKYFNVDPHLGIEGGFMQMIFLRFGVGNFQNEQDIDGINNLTFQPNFGVGVKIKRFSIDYALTDIGDRSIAIYSNVFSLKVDLNRTQK